MKVLYFLAGLLGLSGPITCEESFADFFKPLRLNYLYEMVDAHPEMHKELDDMFKVEKIYNLKEGHNKKVVAYSLFWKATHLDRAQQVVNEQTIYEKNNDVKGNDSFFNAYVKPLIEQLKIYKKFLPGWTARLYIAHDLEFLLPKFKELDVEIFVMASNSIRHSPGAMWRFLVFDDPTISIAYVRDADMSGYGRSKEVLEWLESKDTKGFFRLVSFRTSPMNIQSYSPIVASGFGAKNVKWANMEKAMKGFILHRKFYINEERHGADRAFPPGHPYGFGNQFPDYGFDERFLKHVIYFEAAYRNELTIISLDTKEDIRKNTILDPWILADLKFVKNKAFGPY